MVVPEAESPKLDSSESRVRHRFPQLPQTPLERPEEPLHPPVCHGAKGCVRWWRMPSTTSAKRKSREVKLASLSVLSTAGFPGSRVSRRTAGRPGHPGRRELPLRHGGQPRRAFDEDLRDRAEDLKPEAIQDLFGITVASAFEQTFPWQPNADTVVADTTPPEVSHVLLRGTRLEIRFTEPVHAENAEAAIQLDGEPRSWTVTEDGEVWTTPSDLADGDHTLSISATPLRRSVRHVEPAAEELEPSGMVSYELRGANAGRVIVNKLVPNRSTSSENSRRTFAEMLRPLL